MTRFSHHPPQPIAWTTTPPRQRGYVLVTFALLLVPLLLLAGLSIDVGSWYNRASDMRKAADAAALAGVVWLPNEAAARSNLGTKGQEADARPAGLTPPRAPARRTRSG